MSFFYKQLILISTLPYLIVRGGSNKECGFRIHKLGWGIINGNRWENDQKNMYLKEFGYLSEKS